MICVGQDLRPLSFNVHDDDDDDGRVIQNPSANILPNLHSCFPLFTFVTPTAFVLQILSLVTCAEFMCETRLSRFMQTISSHAALSSVNS